MFVLPQEGCRMNKRNKARDKDDSFEFRIDGLSVKLGGMSVAVLAAAVAAVLYAAANGC